MTDEELMLEESLSVRRAWIEIHSWWLRCWQLAVALRKESVDRNTTVLAALLMYNWSLSVRRAWIEMTWKPQTTYWSLRRSP